MANKFALLAGFVSIAALCCAFSRAEASLTPNQVAVPFSGKAANAPNRTPAPMVNVVGLPMVYVTSLTGIYGFPASANGATSPTIQITGPHTGFYPHCAVGLAVDRASNLYAARDCSGGRVQVWVPGITGDVGPNAVINGPYSYGPVVSMALDTANNLYTTSYNVNKIIVWPAFMDGNVLPIREISGPLTQLHDPWGMAFDKAGDLYVVNIDEILEFAPGATGNVAPIAVIKSSGWPIDSSSVVIDKKGQIITTSEEGSSILVFAHGASGTVAPVNTITYAYQLDCVTVDSSQNFWVLGLGVANPLILEFASTARGKSYPIRAIRAAVAPLGNAYSGLVVTTQKYPSR